MWALISHNLANLLNVRAAAERSETSATVGNIEMDNLTHWNMMQCDSEALSLGFCRIPISCDNEWPCHSVSLLRWPSEDHDLKFLMVKAVVHPH